MLIWYERKVLIWCERKVLLVKWHIRTRQQSLLLHGWVTGLMVWYLGDTLSRVDYRLAVPRRGDRDSSIGV
jgi:hypothetical protein